MQILVYADDIDVHKASLWRVYDVPWKNLAPGKADHTLTQERAKEWIVLLNQSRWISVTK